jgi:replication factor A3
MNEATPRITASYLEQFAHKNVRIVGKVVQLRGDEATIDAGGQITVHLNRVCAHFTFGSF